CSRWLRGGRLGAPCPCTARGTVPAHRLADVWPGRKPDFITRVPKVLSWRSSVGSKVAICASFRFCQRRRCTNARSAANLVLRAPDAVMTYSSRLRTVQQQTMTNPIVFIGNGDAVETGTMKIARPQRNVSGFASLIASLCGKWLELLNE